MNGQSQDAKRQAVWRAKNEVGGIKRIVESKAFINPDAFAELLARGLYHSYRTWKLKNTDK